MSLYIIPAEGEQRADGGFDYDIDTTLEVVGFRRIKGSPVALVRSDEPVGEPISPEDARDLFDVEV